MCGIAGVVDLRGRMTGSELEQLVSAMRESMAHRGPDDFASWVDADGGCALGHRRLSIIDLSADGRQPMSADGVDVVVTYNGEIYNYQTLRSRLEQKGVRFKSRSDTEILPHLLSELDPSALPQLSGMFAIGAWKRGARELFLARDAFGKKPLYVYQDASFFAFASEVQAFYALPNFNAEIDREALADYLMLGYMPGPRTIYRAVRQLEPGSFERVAFAGGRARPVDRGRFFRFAATERDDVAAIDKRALRHRLKQKLIDSVEQRMISDVPLGAFLSGGVDSSLVAAIVRRELKKDLNTFSIGFEGSNESEHEAAREIAAHLGTRHHDDMLKPDGVALINHIASVLDQPNGDSSCLPTYLLSAFTRKHVTVALSGDGGDELFGGYGRYRDTLNELSDPALLRRVHGRDPATATPADLYMSLRWHTWLPDQAAAMLGEMPPESGERIASWRAILNDESQPVIHRMRTIDANVYMPGAVLPKVDRMSMQHSLEVRCPLLDIGFAEIAMGLSEEDCWAPPAATKRILKDIASDYLPAEWMNRSKKGFGLPSSAWAMGDVIALCRGTLATKEARVADHLDARELAAVVERQSRQGHFSIYQMWPLLILELWLREQPAKRARLSAEMRLAS